MKRIMTFLILIGACHDPLVGIKSTKYYKIAIETLRKDNITKTYLLSKEEMEFQMIIVFGKDTVPLVQSELLFCLLDKITDEIYVFYFYRNYSYQRYRCTNHWVVISEFVHVGEDKYY